MDNKLVWFKDTDKTQHGVLRGHLGEVLFYLYDTKRGWFLFKGDENIGVYGTQLDAKHDAENWI
jgi:hypothetical protein